MNIYEKSSTYTNAYTTTLISRKPLQYFPDDYNGSISISRIVKDEKLKEETQNWNKEYYELLRIQKESNMGKNEMYKMFVKWLK